MEWIAGEFEIKGTEGTHTKAGHRTERWGVDARILAGVLCWHVTHRATGFLVPRKFLTEQAAKAFCEDIDGLTDWATFAAGDAPTFPHKDALWEAAVKRGGFRDCPWQPDEDY